MGMMIIAISSLILLLSLTPLKVSFLITASSILMGIQLYWVSNSIFPSASVVISFSSGMMILFCYCAMLTTFESKNKKSMVMLLIMAPPILMLSSNSDMVMPSSPESKKMILGSSSPFTILAMATIIVCMVAINKAMFNPTKPLSSSY